MIKNSLNGFFFSFYVVSWVDFYVFSESQVFPVTKQSIARQLQDQVLQRVITLISLRKKNLRNIVNIEKGKADYQR